MKYNKLGESDLQISEITLGTMTWGNQNTIAEAHEQLDYAFDHGVNFLDAAEMYPVPVQEKTQGLTESYIGEWLAKRQWDKVIVATKIAGPGRGFACLRSGVQKIDRANIEQAVNDSLKRLQTDYIDLYQIH